MLLCGGGQAIRPLGFGELVDDVVAACDKITWHRLTSSSEQAGVHAVEHFCLSEKHYFRDESKK